MTVQTTARNATLEDLAALLTQQQAAKVDLTAPLSALSSRWGTFTVAGTSVFNEGQQFIPTEIADGHIATKLGIPTAYLRTMREQRPDLYDANVNGWIQGLNDPDEDGPSGGFAQVYPPDDRTVLLRTFQGDDPDDVGVLRAVMSDRYGIIENFDVLTAALQGVRDSGTEIDVVSCDLTERKMRIRVAAPDIFVKSPRLLEGYRSPFQNGAKRWGPNGLAEHWQKRFGVNASGVFAGLDISNSETGGGAFSICPVIVVLECINGMKREADALRRIHVGGKLSEGKVDWSDETQRKSLELVTLQARDAVSAFLDPSYVELVLDEITEKAATPIDNPADAVEFVAKRLAFSEEQTAGVLDFFIKGGQVTAGGMMQAVTAFAQTVASPDVADDLESAAMKALDLAAAL